MAEQDPELLQVLIRQVLQNVGVDRVFAECRRILFEAKASKPIPDIHDGVPAPPVCIIIQPKQCVQGANLGGLR